MARLGRSFVRGMRIGHKHCAALGPGLLPMPSLMFLKRLETVFEFS
jgi:hypothetical protein